MVDQHLFITSWDFPLAVLGLTRRVEMTLQVEVGPIAMLKLPKGRYTMMSLEKLQ